MEPTNRSSLEVGPLCGILAIALIASFSAGCTSTKKSVTEPPSSARPTAVLPQAPIDLPPPPPIREVQPSTARAVKVLSDGTEGKSQMSLIEASRMAKAKKKSEGEIQPIIEITDENLKDFSSGGQVFVLEAGEESTDLPKAESPANIGSTPMADSEPAGTEPGPTPPRQAAGRESDRELFWRQSIAELRSGLRRAIEELRRIELESALLRQQFYSETDSFVRDSEIKPRWDRSLDQLNALRKQAKEDHEALTTLLAEAKKSGVAPELLQDSANSELSEDDLRLINGQPPVR